MLDWADDSNSQIGCMTCSATAFVEVGKHYHVEIIFGYGGVAYLNGVIHATVREWSSSR